MKVSKYHPHLTRPQKRWKFIFTYCNTDLLSCDYDSVAVRFTDHKTGTHKYFQLNISAQMQTQQDTERMQSPVTRGML